MFGVVSKHRLERDDRSLQIALLFHREADNPILTAQDWPYPVHSVFNAGACQVGDETVLLLRRGLPATAAAAAASSS